MDELILKPRSRFISNSKCVWLKHHSDAVNFVKKKQKTKNPKTKTTLHATWMSLSDLVISSLLVKCFRGTGTFSCYWILPIIVTIEL